MHGIAPANGSISPAHWASNDYSTERRTPAHFSWLRQARRPLASGAPPAQPIAHTGPHEQHGDPELFRLVQSRSLHTHSSLIPISGARDWRRRDAGRSAKPSSGTHYYLRLERGGGGGRVGLRAPTKPADYDPDRAPPLPPPASASIPPAPAPFPTRPEPCNQNKKTAFRISHFAVARAEPSQAPTQLVIGPRRLGAARRTPSGEGLNIALAPRDLGPPVPIDLLCSALLCPAASAARPPLPTISGAGAVGEEHAEQRGKNILELELDGAQVRKKGAPRPALDGLFQSLAGHLFPSCQEPPDKLARSSSTNYQYAPCRSPHFPGTHKLTKPPSRYLSGRNAPYLPLPLPDAAGRLSEAVRRPSRRRRTRALFWARLPSRCAVSVVSSLAGAASGNATLYTTLLLTFMQPHGQPQSRAKPIRIQK
ncbi:hypothetical protein CALCODRAFT_506338 [Calocera cornea HHB12733]|uniref:Uncharacterized protein n=1 Tax=Calocera cornea HHB12733 TaxID=1353952 RepID=A0A165J471_9BASI|nr:hypothetical protein CALCODRAFT_506338 [Calocera cornea HHB12733]